MTIPRSVKQWCTRQTGYGGFDSWFTTRAAARKKAIAALLSEKRRVVYIGHMTEDRYRNKNLLHGEQFVDVERWNLVKGVPTKATLRGNK